MMPSRTRSGVRSHYNFRVRSRGVHVGRATTSMGGQTTSQNRIAVAFSRSCGRSVLPSARLPACTCVQLRRAQGGCALRCFRPEFIFSFSDSAWIPWLSFIEIEMKWIFDRAFRFCLDTIYIVSFSIYSDCTPWLIFIEIELHSIFDCAFRLS